RSGWITDSAEGEHHDMSFLLQQIVDHIPAPVAEPEGCFEMLVSNIDWDDYVGRVAIGKVTRGSVRMGDRVFLLGKSEEENAKALKVTKVFQYTGLGGSSDSTVGTAGD